MGKTKQGYLEAAGGLPANWLLRHTQILPAPGLFAYDLKRVVFLDMETTRIVYGQTVRPLVACTAEIAGKNKKIYRPAQFRNLLGGLRRASAVVTFNGNHFDLGVLANHLGCSVRSLGITSFDLMAEIEKRCGWKHSLNNLAYVNLNEPKACLGAGEDRSFAQMERDCHSDVRHLRRLFALYISGKLKLPILAKLFTKKMYQQMPYDGQCPVCFDVASINELPPEKPEKEFDAAMLAAVIGNLEACRDLVGVGQAYRCFSCGTIFV